MRFMIPSNGPGSWQGLLAEPQLHWVTGRSARTMAHAWEEARGWPPEFAAALDGIADLTGLEPIWGFPEWKTSLPGGRRSTQTDLLVVAADRARRATFAVEGKVDEPFGDTVAGWSVGLSPGKQTRIDYLADLLDVAVVDLQSIRYQLVHRAAAAKIEARRNASEIAGMLVHSWAPNLEGYGDFESFCALLGSEVAPGTIVFSRSAGLWLGWLQGDPKYLSY